MVCRCSEADALYVAQVTWEDRVVCAPSRGFCLRANCLVRIAPLCLLGSYLVRYPLSCLWNDESYLLHVPC